MSNPIIEGSLNIEDSESETSSVASDDLPQQYEDLKVQQNSVTVPNADSDEELEVFGSASSLNSKLQVTEDVSQPTENDDFSSINLVLTEKSAAQIINSTTTESATTTDEFGISYKRVVRNYNLDEETTKLANQPVTFDTAPKPIEDEFDFDDNDDSRVEDGGENQAKLEVKRLLEKAAERSAEEEKQFQQSLLLAKENAASENALEASDPESNDKNDKEATNFRADAQKAFNEIKEIYSSGMGDQEVLLLDSKQGGDEPSKKSPFKSGTIGSKSLLSNTVIEEVDEEALELEELEEEQLETQQKQQEIEQIRTLEDEWDEVSKVHDTDDFPTNTDKSTVSSSPGKLSKTLSYASALDYFKSLDLSQFLPLIVVKEESSSTGKKSWFGLGSSTSKEIAFDGSKEALEFPFLLAQLDYTAETAEHFAMLQFIYRFFVEKNSRSSKGGSAILPIGNHWEKIGFQGIDPRTDLNRSMKMLTILLTLHLLEDNPSFADVLYQLSTSTDILQMGKRTEDASWPFMCVSVLFTKEALQLLRGGALNDKCNKHKDILRALCGFHHACFAEFARLLKEQPAVHHAVHLATLRNSCASNPLKVLKAYKSNVQQVLALHAVEKPKQELQFDNLDSLNADKSSSGASKTSASWLFGGKAQKFQAST